ncbi:hypothetical protein GR11A_00171 [Vibrio phage vB_VcorM_GR11A]|nr:hypothetical protein GR11A_00171 [Vibrio phage vB_VcorM_GR11A]
MQRTIETTVNASHTVESITTDVTVKYGLPSVNDIRAIAQNPLGIHVFLYAGCHCAKGHKWTDKVIGEHGSRLIEPLVRQAGVNRWVMNRIVIQHVPAHSVMTVESKQQLLESVTEQMKRYSEPFKWNTSPNSGGDFNKLVFS